MQKDSANHIGFSFKDGQIKAIIKDSSAARSVFAFYVCNTVRIRNLASLFTALVAIDVFICDFLFPQKWSADRPSLDRGQWPECHWTQRQGCGRDLF